MGTLVEGRTYTFDYAVTNTADHDITVVPWAACGCTTPVLPSNIIKAGETMIVKAEFDTLGKVGVNDKSLGLFYMIGPTNHKLTMRFLCTVIKQP